MLLRRGPLPDQVAAILRLRPLLQDLLQPDGPSCREAAQSSSSARAFGASASCSRAVSSPGRPLRCWAPSGIHMWQSPASALADAQCSASIGLMLLQSRTFSAMGATERAAENTEPEAAAVPLSADEFRALHGMVIEDASGSAVPDPIQTFDEAGFPPRLLEMVIKAGYSKPTHIQSQAWPIANSGRDLIAIANTGSGKTAGYLVPALAHIREATRKMAGGEAKRLAASALVLAPTRELAKQIQQEAMKFGAPLGLRTACLFGGSPRGMQMTQLMNQPHIIVATPGRLMDFAESGEVDLGNVTYLVLDEADRMLDMGFGDQLKAIMRYLPHERQTLFFSATWPAEVQRIADSFARNRAIKLFVGNVSSRPVAAASINQLFKVVDLPVEKVDLLTQYLQSKPPNSRVIVFVAKKARCDWLKQTLSPAAGARHGVRSVCLHGDMSQFHRDESIKNFKSGRAPILIATDVAARGLDIADVVAVVNFDAPNDVESYVHRIGRTGRAGASGESLTFLSSQDSNIAAGLANVMREAGQSPTPELMALASRGGSGGGQRFGRSGYGGGGGGGGSYGSGYGGNRGGYGRSRPSGLQHGGGGDRQSDQYQPGGFSRGGQPGRTRLSGEFGGRSHRHDSDSY